MSIYRDYSDGIIDINQITSGLILGAMPRLIDEGMWKEWYEGNYNTLFPSTPTVENGYALHSADSRIVPPIYRFASSFFQKAVLSSEPAISSSNATEFDRWWNGNKNNEGKSRPFLQALKLAVEHWSVKGRAILVAYKDGTIEAIDPSSYFRVGRLYDSDEEVGHILAFTYRSFSGEQEPLKKIPWAQVYPNRCRVVRFAKPSRNYPNGINTVQEFDFNGGVIRQPVTEQESAGVASILVAGLGDSFYKDTSTIVRAYIARISNNAVALNLSDNAPLIIPPGIFDYQDTAKPMSAQKLMEQFRRAVRPVLQSDISNFTGKGLEKDIGYDSRERFADELIEILWLVIGVPPSSFGIGVGKNESGAARSKAEHAAKVRATDFRSMLEAGIPNFLRSMGAPGNISAKWLRAPFEDISQELPNVLDLHERGIHNNQNSPDNARASNRGNHRQKQPQHPIFLGWTYESQASECFHRI